MAMPAMAKPSIVMRRYLCGKCPCGSVSEWSQWVADRVIVRHFGHWYSRTW